MVKFKKFLFFTFGKRNSVRVFYLIIILLFPFNLLAQDSNREPEMLNLYGKIVTIDSLKPIENVQVMSRNNFIGTFSDASGNFIIPVVRNDSLRFSRVGYMTFTVFVNDSILSLPTPVSFYMIADTVKIKEVVIKGFPDFGVFKVIVGNMKPLKLGFDINKDLQKKIWLYRNPPVGASMTGPVQILYDLFNQKAILERKLIRNRKKYNKHMIKEGRIQDTIPSKPDYMQLPPH